nr:Beta-ketoacyl synthase [uncultured bacterium]
MAGNDDQRARLTRALAALTSLRSQIDDLKRARSEPIAVVGVGCRYPGGVRDPDGFWQLLHDQRDAIGEVPSDRWDAQAYYAADPDAPGKISTRYGGFLDRIDQFDPSFFGVAPREASSLDPQQRLLLEVAWEAFEHAALAPDRLRGSRTGVFVGISSSEYAQLLLGAGPEKIDSYMGSGNAHSVAAGRLSFVFGFEGPSLAVDTACSSSLVAVHLACQSLRLGECEVALAGGVNVMLTPSVSINHSRARMLAPDGRCKTFDASADGFVRSEGCGLVVLKRLSDALAGGDPILAEIRGSAVNQDGHTSGLTVPSGPAQQRVIRDALAMAGLSPADVSYVEAHGTGTSLGDPIELNALAAVFGELRSPERPLVVGSVKTNIGHAEAAAGIAGLIKVVMALGHDTIPRSLHYREPNPRVAWDAMPLVVAGSPVPWPRGQAPRNAGVSSFGFGGTNAHVVLSDPPRRVPPEPTTKRPLHLLALSAQSGEALRDLAGRYQAHLAAFPGQAVGDLCHTANTGRSHLRHRLCAIADSGAGLGAKLGSFRVEGDTPGLVNGKIDTARAPLIAFLATGQGAQYAGMARGLFETQPVFRRDLETCNELLRAELERPLLDVLYGAAGADALDQTLYTQPALFALEYCLGSLWMSWGVVPDVLMGHSIGEYAAACLAGVFSLEDGIRLVAARARLMQKLPGDGAMAALFASEPEVRSAIAALAPDVSLAAVNGLRHVVVSGFRSSVERVCKHLAAASVESRGLNVSQAFHSALVEPMLAEFRQVAEKVAFSPPRLDLVSNLTGKLAGMEVTRPDYWCRQAREPVRFFEGMRTLQDRGVAAFLEIGPHPVLLGIGRRCVSQPGPAWLASLRRGQDDWRTMLDTLAALYVRGTAVDWRSFDAPYRYRRVQAPTYPFQRQRYWAAPQIATRSASVRRADDPHPHPLLGTRLHNARRPDEILFESELAAERQRLLDEHRVFGAAIMPAAGYIEMALAAGGAALAATRMSVENLTFHRPLVVPDDGTRIVQTSLQADLSGGYAFHVHSRAGEGADKHPWALHASGTLRIETAAGGPLRKDLAAFRERVAEPLPADTVYDAYARHGVAFGPSLRAVEEFRRGEGEALGRVRLPEAVERGEGYWLNPIWLDACAQVLGAATPVTDATYLQTSIRQVRVHRRPEGHAWAYARARPAGKDAARHADVHLLDDAGEVLVELTGLEARAVDAAFLRRDELSCAVPELYALRWLPRPRATGPKPFLPEPATIAAELRPQLEQAVGRAALVEYADALAELDTLAPGYVADAFRQLGWPYRAADRFSARDAQAALGVAPRHGRLLERLLAILAKSGTLRRAGSQWEIVADLPDRARFGAAERYGAARAEWEMLDRCGSRLADVLTGSCDPLHLLYPDGDRAAAAGIYQDSPGAAAMHGLLRAAVARLRESRPAGLRVLEVGAGTGGATAYVLRELPPGTEYVYTDISPGFFAEARTRFADYEFARYETLDIERSPTEQGFAGRQFDLVIAFNVLHATRCLRETIAHVRGLLADGGLLLLLENTEPAEWVDLIWGLTPGWWRFDDHDLRPSYPLLTAEQWRGLLMANGFVCVESVAADPARHEVLARQALLIARKSPDAPPAVAGSCRTWLILADAGSVGAELAERLQARGDRAVRVSRGAGLAQEGEARFAVDPLAAEDFHRLLARLDAAGAPLHGVIHLWGLDAANPGGLSAATLMSDSMASSGSAMRLVQALACAKPERPPSVWLVTRGAQPVGEGGEAPQVGQATLWGMGKAIAREHPELWGGMLDLDPTARGGEAARILDEIDFPDGEDHVALRGGRRFAARLAACEAMRHEAPAVRADGTYLITGGCGALGLETARWLVEQGCRHLALLGRTGAATQAARQSIAALEHRGATVRVLRADVADEPSMRQALAEIERTGFPLRGVVHGAGLPGRSSIVDLDPATLEQMFAAKVAGTWLLHRLTCEAELDFFVCFSSMVSLWGARQQCHYIAANHFLDAFAHYRRSLGLPALCINWGPLSGGGMLPAEDVEELRRIGVSATPLSEAPRTLARLLPSDVAQACAVAIDWTLFQGVYQARGPCRMFDVVASQPRPIDLRAAPPPAAGILERLRDAAENERREILLSHLQSTVGQVLQLESGRTPDSQQGFFDMGMDSLTAMEVRTKLQASLAVSLPPTLVFDYGTLDALADFLLRDKLDGRTRASAAPARDAGDRHAATQDMLEHMSDEETEALLEAKLLTL